jgi:hypothetical protein
MKISLCAVNLDTDPRSFDLIKEVQIPDNLSITVNSVYVLEEESYLIKSILFNKKKVIAIVDKMDDELHQSYLPMFADSGNAPLWGYAITS